MTMKGLPFFLIVVIFCFACLFLIPSSLAYTAGGHLGYDNYGESGLGLSITSPQNIAAVDYLDVKHFEESTPWGGSGSFSYDNGLSTSDRVSFSGTWTISSAGSTPDWGSGHYPADLNVVFNSWLPTTNTSTIRVKIGSTIEIYGADDSHWSSTYPAGFPYSGQIVPGVVMNNNPNTQYALGAYLGAYGYADHEYQLAENMTVITPISQMSVVPALGYSPMSSVITDESTYYGVSSTDTIDFGDGSAPVVYSGITSSFGNFTHIFSRVGTYNATLNVTNVNGGVSFSVNTITVVAAVANCTVKVSAVNATSGLNVNNTLLSLSNSQSLTSTVLPWYNVTVSSPYTFTGSGTGGSTPIRLGDFLIIYASSDGYQTASGTVHIVANQTSYSLTLPMIPSSSLPSSTQMNLLVYTYASDTLEPLQTSITFTNPSPLPVAETATSSSGGTYLFTNITPTGQTATLSASANGYQTYSEQLTLASGMSGTTLSQNLFLTPNGLDLPYWLVPSGSSVLVTSTEYDVPSLSFSLGEPWLKFQSGNFSFPLQFSNTTVNETIDITKNITTGALSTAVNLPTLPTSLPNLPFNCTSMYYSINSSAPEIMPIIDSVDTLVILPNMVIQGVIYVMFFPFIVVLSIYNYTFGLSEGLILGFSNVCFPFIYAFGVVVAAMPYKVQAVVTLDLTMHLFKKLYRFYLRGGLR